jgi:4-hydroxy-tetrahydrodipicolinate reductase
VTKIKIGILGISGRMGQAIVESIAKNPCAELVGGTVRTTDYKISDYFLTTSAKELAEKSDVLIDFANPSALQSHLIVALDSKKPIVIGTTGFSLDTENFMHQVATEIPVLQSGNMSLGVNVLAKLVRQTASILNEDWDIEILEAHHRHKIDSPSGTAIMLGKAAAEGRDINFNDHKVLSREGISTPRNRGDIGFATIRAGSIVGDHSVLFAHDNEMITLSHKAQDRTIFANGAVYAAEKLVNFPAGFYTMQDILPL